MAFDIQSNPNGPKLVEVVAVPIPDKKGSKKQKGKACRKGFKLKVKCINDRIAYKVKTTKPNFYIVNPTKGVLDGHQENEAMVSVIAAMQTDCDADGELHSFEVMAVQWPADVNEFEKEVFDLYQTMGKPTQIISLTERAAPVHMAAGPSIRPINPFPMNPMMQQIMHMQQQLRANRPIMHGMPQGMHQGGMAQGGMGQGGMAQGGMGQGGMAQGGMGQGGMAQGGMAQGGMGQGGMPHGGMGQGGMGHGGMPQGGMGQGMMGHGGMGPGGMGQSGMMQPPGGVGIRPASSPSGQGVQDLVAVYPKSLIFLPPYGMTKQAVEVTVTALTKDKAVAFKMISTDAMASMWKFYMVAPMNGVLLPGKMTNIHFTMKEGFSQRDLLQVPGEQVFTMELITWPPALTAFDQEMWEQLALVHAKKSTVNFFVELDRSGLVSGPEAPPPACTPKVNAAKSPPVAGEPDYPPYKSEGPEVMKLKPTVIAFQEPFGDKKTKKISLQNTSHKPILFKMLANKRQYYAIKPARGHVWPNKVIDVEIELSMTAEEVKRDSTKHQFRIVAYAVSADVKDWDENVWKQCENNKDSKQVVTMDVDFSSAKNAGGNREADLITVSPTKLAFSPPWGRKQVASVKLKANPRIAYKIHSNRTQLYGVKPGKGVLNPGEEVKIEFEMNEKVNEAEARKGSEHKFQLLALPWPASKEYDADDWKALEKSKAKEMQTIILMLDTKN